MTKRLNKELADQTPSNITGHPFTPGPRGWFAGCAYQDLEAYADRPCGLAEAAHAETELKYRVLRVHEGHTRFIGPLKENQEERPVEEVVSRRLAVFAKDDSQRYYG